MKFNLSFFSLLIFLFSCLQAQEQITFFNAAIIIEKNGSLTITETLEVECHGQQIKHGIVREFPTTYSNYGIYHKVPFNLMQVRMDGEIISYTIKNASNGVKLYIGNQNKYISHGLHRFTIQYKTNKQLGFFKEHDELYWNVTGNGWRLPILKAEATVQLPNGTIIKKVEGYTGTQGAKDKNYKATIDQNHANFQTTQPLDMYEGLTIVATWPKGIIQEPSILTKLGWLIKDNLGSLLALLILLIALFLTILSWRLKKSTSQPGTIIPRFYPPKDFPPSSVGFIEKLNYQDVFLSADIVNLAIQGFITITKEEGTSFFSRTKYILTKTKKETTNLSAHDQFIIKKLFASSNSITMSKDNQKLITRLKLELEYEFSKLENNYLSTNDYLSYLIGFLVGGGIIVLGLLNDTGPLSILFLSIAAILTFIVNSYFNKMYLPEGQKLKDEIDGLKLYMVTAELERWKLIGTPPVRTPELFESLLPYAMVLGVEEQWKVQFTEVFKQMEQIGTPYVGMWYYSNSFGNSFNSEVSSVISSANSSSGSSFGSSSGSSGRGSSGGGGGGGGGGGW